MGARGPAPTPTGILKARGSWRANLNSNEPTPEMGKPACPKYFTKAQRATWKKLCAGLDNMGILATIDGNQLERYVVYYLRWRDCEAFLAKNGTTYPMKSNAASCYVGRIPGPAESIPEFVVGFEEYPQVKESHRLDKALKQIEASFGLTPSARARLKAPSAHQEDSDGKGRFFSAVG